MAKTYLYPKPGDGLASHFAFQDYGCQRGKELFSEPSLWVADPDCSGDTRETEDNLVNGSYIAMSTCRIQVCSRTLGREE